MDRLDLILNEPVCNYPGTLFALCKLMYASIMETDPVPLVDIVSETDVFGIPIFYDNTLVQKGYIVTELGGFFHIVGRQKNSHSRILQFQEHLMDFHGSSRIQSAGRLI